MIKDVMTMASLIVSHFPKARQNESLADKTTFGVGGRALGYLPVRSPEELWAAVSEARRHKLHYLVIAGGSNAVFGDELYRGLVIHYLNPEGEIKVVAGEVSCEAGVPLAHLIEVAMNAGLAGMETLSGIPGTVGGAIVGNAGAYGQCISDHLVAVQIFDPVAAERGGGKIEWITKEQGAFAYRDSIFKKNDWLVLRARFQLAPGDPTTLHQKSREIITLREKKYAPGLRCPGSFFKNVLVKKVSKKSLALVDQSKIIEGKIPSGYLLQAAGACGLREGGAVVADFHGNLIINEGAASYHDVRELAKRLKKLVKERFGIKLEEEVRYML
jgi:UDP-N-acetylmuramate dehydrogenase